MVGRALAWAMATATAWARETATAVATAMATARAAGAQCAHTRWGGTSGSASRRRQWRARATRA
eukprot:2816744-Pleurochrysis_carterae.AAC.1